MPRPSKQPNEKRLARVSARVTFTELAQITAAADAAGLTMAEFLRCVALGANVTPRRRSSNAMMLVELNFIGVKLNQLAQYTSSSTVTEELQGTLTDLRHVLLCLLHQSDRRPMPKGDKIDIPANS